jgi:hypothetical protein
MTFPPAETIKLLAPLMFLSWTAPAEPRPVSAGPAFQVEPVPVTVTVLLIICD